MFERLIKHFDTKDRCKDQNTILCDNIKEYMRADVVYWSGAKSSVQDSLNIIAEWFESETKVEIQFYDKSILGLVGNQVMYISVLLIAHSIIGQSVFVRVEWCQDE